MKKKNTGRIDSQPLHLYVSPHPLLPFKFLKRTAFRRPTQKPLNETDVPALGGALARDFQYVPGIPSHLSCIA